MLQQAIRDCDAAYRNFFDSLAGKRAGKRVGVPRFTSKRDRRQAIRLHSGGFSIRSNGKLRLAKIGDVSVSWSWDLPSMPSSVTIITTTLSQENQLLVVEDLAVSVLARTRLAKSVHDASWGHFRRLLLEKVHRYGRELVVIDRWLPTSQTCSDCGRVDGPKPLDVREWECPCGAVRDRDCNAAINILAAGRAERLNACGGQVRPRIGAQVVEAGSSVSPRGSSTPHAA